VSLQSGLTNGMWSTVRITRVSATNTSISIDGNTALVDTSSIVHDAFTFLFARYPTVNDLVDNYLKGDVEYINFNGDMLTFKHTGATHLSDSGNVTVVMKSGDGQDITLNFTAKT